MKTLDDVKFDVLQRKFQQVLHYDYPSPRTLGDLFGLIRFFFYKEKVSLPVELLLVEDRLPKDVRYEPLLTDLLWNLLRVNASVPELPQEKVVQLTVFNIRSASQGAAELRNSARVIST